MTAPLPRPARIPMCQAFSEAVAIVRNGLEANGIRWDPQAEQDAVSTLLIQAGKAGMLLPWNPPHHHSPVPALPDPLSPVPALPDHPLASERDQRSIPSAIPINSHSQPRQEARQGTAAPTVRVLDPPGSQPRTAPASVKSPNAPPLAETEAKRPSGISVMIRAFREVEPELPPEVWSTPS